jgi:parallel beta-helix repeat protein
MLVPALRSSLAAVLVGGLAFSGTLYVDADLATGANNGSSWADAYQGSAGLQTALAAAVAGDQIFVAEGRYVPTQTTTRTISFALKSGVAIYGSFLGTESTPAERPPFGSAWSILDGDLLGDDATLGIADNSFHLITTTGTNSTAILDGFTVRGGNANTGGSNNDRGGGILIVSAVSPTIRNCLFTNNRCTFGGAAGYISSNGAPTFTNVTFQNGNGGSFGGAFDIAGGGALRFDRCLFQNNTAARAGALEIFSSTGPIVSNCVFRSNTATGSGGGGGVWLGSGGNPQIRNCTIVGNSTTNVNGVGGLRNQGATNATIANCILYDNEGPGGAQAAANQTNTGNNITYSIVEGGYTGTGNSAADPQFVNAAGLDFRLLASSPGVDAGNSAAVPAFATLDFAGAVRFQDVPGKLDKGAGTTPRVDIGAHETAPTAFTAIAGCFANTADLSSPSQGLQVGQNATLKLAAGLYPTGLGLYFLGVDGTVAGCGLPLPGLGEVLLALAPFPSTLGTAATVSGLGTFAIAVPNSPSAAGLTVAFQAANVDLIGAGNPVELSTGLFATIAP